MMTRPEIQKFYGTPVDYLPKPMPNAMYKYRRELVLVGVAVVGLAIYGGYCLYKNYFDREP